MVRRRFSSTECPICMDATKFGVETNCGHSYCGGCIIQVWNLQQNPPILCPNCRQTVTILLPYFSEAEKNVTDLSEIENREEITAKVNEYNTAYSQHPRSIWGQLIDLPTILRHVWADFFTFQGLHFFYRIRIGLCIIFAILYAIFPFDLLPESILGIFGLLDDIIVVIFLLIQVGIFYRSYVGNVEA